jgi:hypothetical protein
MEWRRTSGPGRKSPERAGARAQAHEADEQTARLRAQIDQLEGTKREQQGRLDKFGKTIADLERKVREAEAAKAAAPPPPVVPRPELPKASSLDSLFASAVTDPDLETPPAPPPPSREPEAPAPKSASTSRIDTIFDPDPPSIEPPEEAKASPPPKETPPASSSSVFDPEPPTIPQSQSVPSSSSSHETTLKPQHAFGPDGEDGQPIYVLHELLPPDEMGVLYRASERADGRQFAVRFLAGQAGEEQTQAIEREVERLIALPHPDLHACRAGGRPALSLWSWVSPRRR